MYLVTGISLLVRKKIMLYVSLAYCSLEYLLARLLHTPLIQYFSTDTDVHIYVSIHALFILRYPTTILSTDLVVRSLDYESVDSIFLITDTTLIGTGTYVGQGPRVPEIQPAAFHSRKVQLNYLTFDKELLAIVYTLEHF